MLNNSPPTFVGNEFAIAIGAVAVMALFFIVIGAWLKFSGMRQHKKAKSEEEAELNIFQRGDADIVSDGSLERSHKEKR